MADPPRRRSNVLITPQAQPVDLATWPRRAHFAHYRDRVPCTYSVTVELDVTEFRSALHAAGRKTYPAQI